MCPRGCDCYEPRVCAQACASPPRCTCNPDQVRDVNVSLSYRPLVDPMYINVSPEGQMYTYGVFPTGIPHPKEQL